MLSNHPNDTVGMAASQDLEHAGFDSYCAPQSQTIGPWLVLSDYGWQIDPTLLIKCIE